MVGTGDAGEAARTWPIGVDIGLVGVKLAVKGVAAPAYSNGTGEGEGKGVFL